MNARRMAGVSAWMMPLAWVLAAALLVGCGSKREQGAVDGESAAGGSSELAGKVVVDGSSTVYPITEAVASEFVKDFPNVEVPVGVSGTGGGFNRFSVGETDISDASRPIQAEEFKQCQAKDVSFVELPVAYDGLTVVVNPENDFVNQLTVDQLRKLFLQDGAAKLWSDVDPQWPETPVKIYSPGTDSGTFDYFKEVLVEEDGQAIRSDISVSEDDNVLVTGVAGEKHAIGFFGAAYYFENEGKLKAVKIVNPETGEAVLPNPQAIESGEYAPFSRPLFIYVNEQSLRRPEVKKFVDFYLERAGEAARKVGYVALPTELYDRAREHYEQRLTGTHFLTADMEKREGSLSSLYTQENLVPVE